MGIRLPKTKGMLRREAASWLARLQSGRDSDIENKFRRWRDADPRHAEAFDRVHRSYEQAGLLRHSPAAVSGKQGRAIGKPEWKPRPALAAAAALAVLVPVGLLLVGRNPLALGSTEVMMLATSVGEIKSVKLSDGSKVILDTASSVEVEVGRSARKARLKSGRVRFEVADAARPFVVDAGSATVSTDGGVVDVQLAGEQSRVVVLAGTSDVRRRTQQGSDALMVEAGQAVTADAAGLAQKESVPYAPDWTRGMLQFDGTPIAQAIALANRYSNQHIVIDRDLDQLRVTGAFRAGDTEGLGKALAAAFRLSLRRTVDGNLLLTRGGSAPSQK